MGESPAKPRLLLIDDEPYILEALARQLRAEPFEVKAYRNPLDALESLFQLGEFAIIMSDNQMPGLKGLDLLARAKEFAPHTRRLLLTGHTELNEAIAAFNDGVIHRFINKPWDADDLVKVLREELAAYEATRRHVELRGAPAAPSGEAHGNLRATVEELKQALTQVALHEDSNRTRRLHVTPQMRRLTVLVVEENAKVRQLLVKTLQSAGMMSVSAVGGVEEALRHLHQVPAVDVILSEWNLPGLDGMALFQALRSGQTPSAKAIFIIMTTRENREAVEQALSTGVDYYLIKPFHLDTLFDQIDKLLRRGRKDATESRVARLRKLQFVVSNIDRDTRYKIQQMLALNGMLNVSLADSVSKALRVIQERKVDVLILDCNLVDVQWAGLRFQLREVSGKNLPPSVVVTSISPMPQEFERIHEAGITAFLPGPVRQRDLIDSIFKALENDERHDILDAE